MRLVVEVDAEGVRPALGRERAAELARFVLRAEGVRDALVSLTFVSNATIARLNRRHLGHAGATDVISFGLQSPHRVRPVAMGDVYIAPDVARRNAREHGCGVREETARLVVHGLLHVLGHDHPEGTARTASSMWRRQERLLSRAREAGTW
jgi:probable rRNA maturation factor